MFSFLKGAIGEIHSINESDYTVRVKLLEYEEVITEDLQVTTLLSFGKTSYLLPDVNTPVLVIFFDDNTDKGFVIAGFYSAKNKADGDKDKIIFDCEGNYFCLNRKDNSITIISKEKIEIKSKNISISCDSFSVKAKDINLKGKTISLEANESISIKSALIEVLGLIKSKFVIYAKDFLKQ
ncbi:hypothetical protein H3N56_02465 [Cetobacterium sp. 2A]|uniref:hypothetical protein n=1 Tax=Cetobacterium sp. 2A TaxID=2754723 RepID=UPI00163D1BA6|nr:hypothetical protein [Cetobacterium sp. 2A]MBC2855356.1 hypothetical protein [Cetobacterium sp. 2A]